MILLLLFVKFIANEPLWSEIEAHLTHNKLDYLLVLTQIILNIPFHSA